MQCIVFCQLALDRAFNRARSLAISVFISTIIFANSFSHEVVELPAVRFSEPLLGGHHLQVGRLGYAVAPSDQPRAVQNRLLRLHHIGQHTQHSAGGLFLVSDGGEGTRTWLCVRSVR